MGDAVGSPFGIFETLLKAPLTKPLLWWDPESSIVVFEGKMSKIPFMDENDVIWAVPAICMVNENTLSR